MKSDCDGKRCDETAIPCSFARQVVYSLQCDKKDLQEDVAAAEERGFYGAVLSCLQILCVHDSHTQAMEIVRAVGGIRGVEAHASRSGSDVDADTVRWLKTLSVERDRS